MDLIFILLTQLINQTTFNLDFQVVNNHGRRLLPKLRPGKTRFAKPSRVLRRFREQGRSWKFRVLLDGEFTGIELEPQVILDYVRVVFRVDRNLLWVDGVREILGSTDVLLRHRYFGCMRNFYWDLRPVEAIDRSDSKLATKLRNLEDHCQHLAPFVDLQKRYASTPKESPQKKKGDHKYKEDEIRVPPDEKYEKDEIKGPPAEQPRPKIAHRPRPLEPSVRSEESKSMQSKNATTVNHNIPPPWEIGGNDIERLHPYDALTAQGEDDSSTNVVEKDSFVHGILLVFALIVCIWMKFLF